jgi:hypothetical protein
MALSHAQKIELFCEACSFSVIGAGVGIASGGHPVHFSMNDIKWSAENGRKQKGNIHACRPGGGLR